MLWQVIGNLKPASFVRCPNMRYWPHAGITIKRTHPYDDMRRVMPRGHQMRAAARAKKSFLSGRGFKVR
jgi:hypothetical protein